MKRFLWSLAPVVLAALALGYLTPAEASTDRMIYVNLTLVDGKAHLNDIAVVKGHLKQRKAVRIAPNHLYYVVTSVLGETLYEGSIPDPSLLRVEYMDDGGRMQIKTVRRDITDFSIRLPYHPDAHRVTIRRIGSAIPEIERLTETTTQVGSFEIDLREEDRP